MVFFKKIIPFLIIISAVLIFFYPVLFFSKVPLPADLAVGSYYPWLDYTWGSKVGVLVKNPITSDAVSFVYPMQNYALQQLKLGEIPLWNPLILMGTPLLANFQSAPFSPTKILHLILPMLDAWNLQIILQLLLAALSTYFLLREFGRGRVAAVGGGLTFAFSGFLLIWMEWNAHSLVAAFFPLIFFLILKWLKTGKIVFAILISLSLALQVFSGYPQIIVYELIFLPILVLVLARQGIVIKGKIMPLVFFLLLGLGISSIQLLPGLELINLSQRKVEVIPDMWTFLPWQLMITFFTPDFFGNHSTYNWWGPGNYTLLAGYTGLVTIILASYGFFKYRKHPGYIFGLLMVLFAVLISFNNPLTILFKKSGFLSLQAATAHRSLVLLNLGLAILASFGVDRIYRNEVKVSDIVRSFYLPVIVLIGVGLGSLFSVWWLKLSVVLSGNGEVEKTLTNYGIGLRNLIFPLIILVATAAVMFGSIRQRRLSKFAAVLLVVISLMELFRFGWKYTPFSPRSYIFPSTSVIDFLQKQEKPFRVLAQEVIPTNFLMVYNIETLEGYDAVYPLRTAKYLSVLNSQDAGSLPQDRYGAVTNINSPLLDLSNVRFILALKKDKYGRVEKTGQVNGKYQSGRFKKVFEDRSVVVLENRDARPRAKIYYDWQVLNDDQAILSRLMSPGYINEKVILEEDPGIFSGLGEGKVKILDSLGANLQVETDKPGVLFIANSWYPGWRVWVNGREEKVLRADYNFLAVPLKSSGQSTVKLKYLPDSYQRGKMISLISGVVLLLMTGYFLAKKEYKR